MRGGSKMKLKYIGEDGASGLRCGEVYDCATETVGGSVWVMVHIPGVTDDGYIAIKYKTLKGLRENWEEV